MDNSSIFRFISSFFAWFCLIFLARIFWCLTMRDARFGSDLLLSLRFNGPGPDCVLRPRVKSWDWDAVHVVIVLACPAYAHDVRMCWPHRSSVVAWLSSSDHRQPTASCPCGRSWRWSCFGAAIISRFFGCGWSSCHGLPWSDRTFSAMPVMRLVSSCVLRSTSTPSPTSLLRHISCRNY